MIKKDNLVSIMRQCRLFDLNRSGLYYKPAAPCEEEYEIKRLIDVIHTNRPFLGGRRITDALQGVNYRINHKRVERFMKEMGIQAIYPKPNTSKPNSKHKIYPYLLRNLKIDKPNQVWATDITYIPMPKGFAYLTVIMDWYSRKVLSWRLSNSMDTSFCVDVLEEALHYHGKPEIFNSDQGSQYTSEDFISTLKASDIRVSMDGKGAWRDNVFVERLWRSVKYEEAYLNAYESMKEAKDGIGQWIEFYNRERKHQTLGMTPDMMYGISSDLKMAA